MATVKTSNLKDYTREEAYAMSQTVGKAWDEFMAREAEKAEEASAEPEPDAEEVEGDE